MPTLMPAVSTEAKISEVELELTDLAQERQILDQRLQELEKRLEPILAQRLGQEGGSTSTPEPTRVPLAQRIHDQAMNLSAMNAQLAYILNRIEL